MKEEMKIWVTSEREFNAIIDKAEELGYSPSNIKYRREFGYEWHSRGKGGVALFLDKFGSIGYDPNRAYFNNHTLKEMTCQEFVGPAYFEEIISSKVSFEVE